MNDSREEALLTCSGLLSKRTADDKLMSHTIVIGRYNFEDKLCLATVAIQQKNLGGIAVATALIKGKSPPRKVQCCYPDVLPCLNIPKHTNTSYNSNTKPLDHLTSLHV